MDSSGMGCSICPDNIIHRACGAHCSYLCVNCVQGVVRWQIEPGRCMSKNSREAEVRKV